MTYRQIGRLTPAQLRQELGGESDAEARAHEMLADKRAEIFRKVCDYYRLKPRELADVFPTDLARMIQHVTGVPRVDITALSGQVAEFLT